MKNVSKQIVRKEVFKASIWKPTTSMPVGVGVLCGGIYLFVGGPGALSLIMYGGISLGIFSFIYNIIFRREKHSNDYIKKLEKEFLDKEKKDLRILRRSLRSTKLEEDVKKYGDQAYGQLLKIQEKYQNYKKILSDKFTPGELTHRRYLGVGEEVYLLTLENLKTISSTLETTNLIKTDSILDRMNTLENEQTLTDDEQSELNSLKERLKIKENQFSELSKVLSINEAALTKLDEASISLSNINTNKDQSGQHIEIVLKQLEQLAKSAVKYNIK